MFFIFKIFDLIPLNDTHAILSSRLHLNLKMRFQIFHNVNTPITATIFQTFTPLGLRHSLLYKRRLCRHCVAGGRVLCNSHVQHQWANADTPAEIRY